MAHQDHACPGCEAPDLAFAAHDHAHCAADALGRAEAMVAEKGGAADPGASEWFWRFCWRSIALWEPMMCWTGWQPRGLSNQPPVAYRALDFLEEQGLRILSAA